MKKIYIFIILFVLYIGKCFSQKTTDTLLTSSTATTAIYTVPNMTQNDLTDNLIKIIAGLLVGIITQLLKDIFIKKKGKN